MKNWSRAVLLPSLVLTAASLSGGCASTDDAPRYNKGDREYQTGSRIPRRDIDPGVSILGREALEAAQGRAAPAQDPAKPGN